MDICCRGWRNPIGPRAIKDFFTRIFKVFTKFPEWRETTSLIDEMRKQVCKQANNSSNTKLFFPLEKVNVRTKNYPAFFYADKVTCDTNKAKQNRNLLSVWQP